MLVYINLNNYRSVNKLHDRNPKFILSLERSFIRQHELNGIHLLILDIYTFLKKMPQLLWLKWAFAGEAVNRFVCFHVVKAANIPVPLGANDKSDRCHGRKRSSAWCAFWAWRRVITWENQMDSNHFHQNSSFRWESNTATGFCQILLAVSSEVGFSIPVLRSLTLPDSWRLRVDSHLQESHQVTEPADFHLFSTFNVLMN